MNPYKVVDLNQSNLNVDFRFRRLCDQWSNVAEANKAEHICIIIKLVLYGSYSCFMRDKAELCMVASLLNLLLIASEIKFTVCITAENSVEWLLSALNWCIRTLLGRCHSSEEACYQTPHWQ
jgi:hypothetical protein